MPKAASQCVVCGEGFVRSTSSQICCTARCSAKRGQQKKADALRRLEDAPAQALEQGEVPGMAEPDRWIINPARKNGPLYPGEPLYVRRKGAGNDA